MHTGTCRELGWLFSGGVAFPPARRQLQQRVEHWLGLRELQQPALEREQELWRAPPLPASSQRRKVMRLRPILLFGRGTFPAEQSANEKPVAIGICDGHRREAPGRAKGYGCLQLYPSYRFNACRRKTAYVMRKRHARQRTEAPCFGKAAGFEAAHLLI